VVLALISLVSYFAIAILNNVLLKALKVVMSLGESFLLSVVTGFYNLITPFRGGMAVRAVYLKKKYDFAYVHFLASLSAVYVLTFLVASFLGIVSTLWIYFETGMFSWILFVIFDVVFLGMLGIIFVSPKFKEFGNDSSPRHARPDGKYVANLPRPRMSRGKGNEESGFIKSEGLKKWLNRFIKVINGWHFIKNNTRVIVVTSVVTLIQILISSLMLWLQFRVFGVEVSFVSAVFLSAIGSLSLVIGLTPGNLGVQEAIIVFSAATIGITPAESLSAALLGRAVSLVVLFVLGPIFSYVLMRGNSKSPQTSAVAESRPSTSAAHSPNKIVELPLLKKKKEGDKIVELPLMRNGKGKGKNRENERIK